MHILYLCNEFPPYPHGGIGSFVQTIAKELTKQGHKVTVIGVYRQSKMTVENDAGIEIIRIPNSKIPKIGFIINNFNLINHIKTCDKKKHIDVIEGQENAFAFHPKKTSWKKVIRMHGGHHFFFSELGQKPRIWHSFIERRSFSRVDAFGAVSSFVAETTTKLLKLAGRQITILPNPVDTDLFKPLAGIQEEPGMILFVGTVTEKKGIRQLIEAMPAIQKAIPAAHLFVVGRDSFDKKTGKSYTDYLKKNIAQDISGSIQFIGPIPNKEVSEWVARAQVCVYPSHMEAQGIVVIEAMAAGKAVVASKLGPGPELINHGIDGLLCDPYNPVDIADKVTSLLTDPVLRQNLSLMARKKVEEKFSIDVIIAKNISFYDTVLGK
jgi:glycosyltransferase involved in cell wall biosynthesis